MVQRYNMYISAQAFGRCHMDEKADGKFVKYEDYAALEETALIAMEALEKAQKQIDNLERALGAGELRYD